MAVVIIQNKVTEGDLAVAIVHYDGYIKIVVDVETGAMAIGGEWHVDAEKELVALGSHKKDLWGGGIDIITKKIDFNSLINTKPDLNISQEILDVKIRDRFEQIVKEKYNL